MIVSKVIYSPVNITSNAHKISGNLAQYRWPALSTIVNKLMKPRPSPLTNAYVLNSCMQPNPGTQTLLHKLQNSKDSFSQIEIAAECMDHLAAGIDTTGDALCFVMYQLSLPETSHVQDNLIEELRQNKDKTFEDMPYLDAVIKEGLRCFPPIPMSQPRYIPDG